MKKILLALSLFTFSLYAISQCNNGELEVTIDVSVDNYGSEIYWELVPGGNNCGNGTIFSGGNSLVGCNGAGAQIDQAGGYTSNSEITEGPWCLTEGSNYKIISIDDWGDGGPSYAVNVGGFPMYNFTTSGSSTSNTFAVNLPPELEIDLHRITTPTFVDKGNIIIAAQVINNGATAITSLDVSYTINNGSPVSSTISNLNILPFDELEIKHPIVWEEETSGQYSVVFSITSINGQASDFDNTNNEKYTVINLKDPIPNIIPSYLSASTTFDFVVVANSGDQVSTPTDLDFHPNGDLWVINRNTENTGGSTVKITNPTSSSPSKLWQRDGNAWHFMSLPSAISFSDNGNFGTSTSVFDANHSGGASPFSGPSLWSSDPAIYAQPSGGNGSHFDMLHESPYSMGITAYKDNAFWVFDKYSNDIVMYDFKADHGPGNDDHSDAVIHRYPEVSVEWIAQEIPSHLKYDKFFDVLYIVDGGNGRVLKMDVNSGTVGGTPSFGALEPLAEYQNVTGVDYSELTSTGFTQACGIDVITNYMIISDYSNGDIIIYDNNKTPSEEVGRIATGSAGITGVVIGPEGKIWYTNANTNEVVRIEPSQIILSNNDIQLSSNIKIYPNPSNGMINIDLVNNWNDKAMVNVYDSYGRIVHNELNNNKNIQLDLNHLSKGFYLIEVKDDNNSIIKKISIK